MGWRSSRLRRLADTVVVAGGGFTGIETATEMPGRLRTILGAHFIREAGRISGQTCGVLRVDGGGFENAIERVGI
jgi:hypothetical protein